MRAAGSRAVCLSPLVHALGVEPERHVRIYCPVKGGALFIGMANFETLLVFHRGREWPITNLHDAQLMATRLLLQQKFEGDPELVRVRGAIDQAVAGHQSPAAAIRAFAEFARARGILATTPRSSARDNFEKMLGPRRMA